MKGLKQVWLGNVFNNPSIVSLPNSYIFLLLFPKQNDKTKETNYQTVSKQFKLLAHEDNSQVVKKVKHTITQSVEKTEAVKQKPHKALPFNSMLFYSK